MKYLIICEDITLGVQGQKDWETPGGIAPIAECMFMGQKYEIGVLPVSHSLSGLSPVIRQNIPAWVVTGLPAEDSRLICNVLNTDFKQADKARTLERGQFIILNPVLWPKPLFATFSPPFIPGICSESMRKAGIKEFLKRVKTTPPAPLSASQPKVAVSKQSPVTAKPKLPELPSRCSDFLIIVATTLPSPVGKIDERMGLGFTQSRRVRKSLEDIGYIRIHAFATGKIGGRIYLVEITDQGWMYLINKGHNRPKSRTNGDWEHQAAACLIEAEGIRLGYRNSFEVPFGGIQGDVQWLDNKTGTKTIFNIGISRPEHEVDSIQKFLELPIARESKFTLVARDSYFVKKVKAVLKQRDPKGDILRRIEIKVIADFINN